jgi:heme o synthase
MKFSLRSRFSRLSLFVLVVMLIVEFTGRLSSINHSTMMCIDWPLCYPLAFVGWLQLIHRIAVGLAVISVLILSQQAWSKFRDNSLILATSTIVTILFFSDVFTGAINIMRGHLVYLPVLHSLTAVVLWIFLFTLVIATGYLANGVYVEFPPINFRERARDLLMLTKPVIVSLLLVTTLGGMIAGLRAIPSFWLIFWTLLGGALAAGGASALNQYIDRDLDKNMQRTSNRPLSSGRMLPAEGLAFGLALSVISFYVLAGFVNLLAALLGLAGIIYYVWLYSIMLKKATVQNIVIGGGAGAIPPLVGWAAATGNLSTAAWFMFAIIFLWTPPHFWALSIVRKKDYERAGIPMLPVVQGEQETRRQIWLYSLLLVGVSILMPVLHLAGTVFLISAVVLGLWILSAAWKVYKGEGNKSAWKMYRYTSIYLLFIFLILVIDALV